MKIRFEPRAMPRIHPGWHDLTLAVGLVTAIVLLNLFVDAVDRNVLRGQMLRQAQRAEVLAQAQPRPAEAAPSARLAHADVGSDPSAAAVR